MDIDHFKRVNDTYGHGVGDVVLRRFVQDALPQLRQVDKLGRWGGEEFLLVCPDTELAGAGVLADKLRLRIKLTKPNPLFLFSLAASSTSVVPPEAVAKYGDQPLLVVKFADAGGRDWVTQSPSRGDEHLVQERGLRQRRTQCEIIFADQAGAGDYLERWLAFRALAERAAPALFTHPTDGAYLAVVVDLQAEVELPERAVRVSCAFVAAAPPVAVFPVGAGATIGEDTQVCPYAHIREGRRTIRRN